MCVMKRVKASWNQLYFPFFMQVLAYHCSFPEGSKIKFSRICSSKMLFLLQKGDTIRVKGNPIILVLPGAAALPYLILHCYQYCAKATVQIEINK